MSAVTERFLRYAAVHTTSDENSGTTPSAPREFDLARLLADELTAIGASDVTLTETGYVYATVPATAGREQDAAIGFIAHIDTSPDFSGEHVCPQIHPNYDGGAVALGDSGLVLDPAVFSHLPELRGRTLITSDGTTLLGADDKAGVAEIMTAADLLLHTDRPHGKICVAFTPDEEIGEGAHHFDLKRFGADFAYTVDGGPENEIEYENFNAASAVFSVTGVNVHPGSAKDIMVNAALVACEINSMLPAAETPAHTEGYEGFYHLCEMHAAPERAVMKYIVRDHDANRFAARLDTCRHIEKVLGEKYGADAVRLVIREQYRNMAEKILPRFEIVERAQNAIRAVGAEPVSLPVRGGTDGAQLSFMGLPCPNLGTGGYAFHGPFEHVTVEGMETAVSVLLKIAEG